MSRGRERTASTTKSLARTLCRSDDIPLGSSMRILQSLKICAASAGRRPDGSARFDWRTKARGVNHYRLRNQLIHETVCSLVCIAQLPEVSLSNADPFAPQKIVKDLAKNHQLACHFINQRALMKANLRMSAQAPCGLCDFAFGGRQIKRCC